MKAPGVADARRSHHSATAFLSWAVSQAPSTPPVAISSPPSCGSHPIQMASTTLSPADGRTGCIDLPALLSRPSASSPVSPVTYRRVDRGWHNFLQTQRSDTSNFSLTCSIHLRQLEVIRSFPPPSPSVSDNPTSCPPPPFSTDYSRTPVDSTA